MNQSAIELAAKHQQAIDLYYTNPKICLECFSPIPYKTSANITRKKEFCNRICWISYIQGKTNLSKESVLKGQPKAIIAAAELKRKTAIEKYTIYPKYCKNCGNIIPISNIKPSIWKIKNKKFCNKKCFNLFRKRSEDEYIKNPNFCRHCKSPIPVFIQRGTSQIGITKRKKFCNKICSEVFNKIHFKKKNETKKLKERLRSYSEKIREKIINMIISAFGKIKCIRCEYDKHIQIAHIFPMSKFLELENPKDINSLNNLLALCPNCHWELDNRLISNEEIESLKKKMPK